MSGPFANYDLEVTEWTKEPPTEPGWYFYRDFPALPDTQIMRVHRDMMADSFSGIRTDMLLLPGEWWPIPIQEPPK